MSLRATWIIVATRHAVPGKHTWLDVTHRPGANGRSMVILSEVPRSFLRAFPARRGTQSKDLSSIDRLAERYIQEGICILREPPGHKTGLLGRGLVEPERIIKGSC